MVHSANVRFILTDVKSLIVELGKDTHSWPPQATAAWRMWAGLLWILHSA